MWLLVANVQLFVHVSDTLMSPAKMVQLIDMTFGITSYYYDIMITRE